MASVVAFIALREARLNEERAELATIEAHDQFAGALGAAAYGLVEADPLLALSLGAEAVVRAGTQPPAYDARATMLAARRALSQSGPFLVGSPVPAGDALSIAVSPDGAMLASAQREGAIDIIDTATRRPVGPRLRGHVGGVRDVEFSPDGRWLASAGADGTVRLWTVEEGLSGRGRKIGETGDVVMGVCFGPDGSIIATGNGEGTVQLWDVVQGQPIGEPLIDLALGFNVVEFSPDGILLATGDRVLAAEGCLSGTLAFLMTRLEQGVPLSAAVEEAVRGLEVVKEVTSRARENSGTVSVELTTGTSRERGRQVITQQV